MMDEMASRDKWLMMMVLTGAVVAAWGATVTAAGTPAEVIVKPAEVDTLFANPHKGWLAGGRNPNRTPWFPASTAYIRYNWEELEPAEGQYRWERIDEPLAAWSDRGVRLALRIMTTNAHTRGYYCSPNRYGFSRREADG